MLNTIRSQLDARTVVSAVITVAVFLVLLVIPLPGDLPVQGQRVLAVMGLAVTLWITVLLPPPLTGLLAVVLLVLVGGVDDIDQALVGFSKPVAYFLLGILTLPLASRNIRMTTLSVKKI